jgi:hypothetical protein
VRETRGTPIAEPGRIPDKLASGIIEHIAESVPAVVSPSGDSISRPVAVLLKEQSGAGQPSDAGSSQSPDLHESQSERAKQLWSGEVDQLFTAAFDELRRQAEQRLETIEKRRIAEITELSQAIRKQHGIIESLRRELAQAKEATALKLFDAEQKWQRSESERMNAARRAWEREREELTRETNHQRSIADQLADQLAALKATAESKEGQLLELKKIAAEIDRCLLLARSEWQSEVARLEAAGWELPSCLKEAGPATQGS